MKQTATINIAGLCIPAVIGTHARERAHTQDLIVHLDITYDAQEAMKTDNLDHALDYESLTREIITFVQESRFQLLETLADRVLRLVQQHALVVKATVRIDKPRALTDAKMTSVVLSTTGQNP